MAQVYWISGNLAERKLLLNKIKQQFSGYDMQVFSGDESFAYCENAICTSSCFSEKRLVIFNKIPDVETKKRPTMINRFKKLLENLPEDVFIVFNGIDPGDEKALFSHVEKIGKVYTYESVLDQRNASQWIVAKFYSYGKTISEEDADFLVQTSGYDRDLDGIGVDLLSLTVKKICTYVGNRRKNITRDDLIITGFESEKFVVWQLFNAFDSKDIQKCYEVIEKIKTQNEHLRDAAESIFAISLWRYKMLFFMKEEQARRSKNAPSFFSSLSKLFQSGSGWKMKMNVETNENGQPKAMYSAYSIKEAFDGQFGRQSILSLYSRKELRRILEALEQGMNDVRAHSDDDRDRGRLLLLFDTLVFTICNVTDDTEVLKAMRMSNG